MTWLLANSLVAALLAALVLLIGRWARPTPAVMHGLWLIVLLKLATPPLFEVPIDLRWARTPAATPTAAATRPPDDTPADHRTAAPTASSPEPPRSRAAEPAPTAPDSVRRKRPDSSTPLPIGTLLSIVWGCGSLWLLAMTTIGALHARRRVHALPAATGPLRREVEQLAERMGVAVPALHDDAAAAAPYVWALGRTRMIVPAALLASCTHRGRAAVLAHELAHLRRGDHWVARLELVLRAVLWWHPLFWLARSQLRLWAELACDALAVRTVPGAGLDYATVLVDAVARPDPAVPGLAVLASRPAARAAFERRLTMILNDQLSGRAGRAWCVPFAALTLGLFAGPVAAQREQDPEPVQIEVRINGQRVQGLSPEQQRQLIDVLLRGRASSTSPDERPTGLVRRRAPARMPAQDPVRRDEARVEGLPSASELRGIIDQGLAEARREIQGDKDLRELGITDEVLGLIDGIADGKGIDSSLDGVVRAAMKGAGRMVVAEIENDPDLRQLGIGRGIAGLVTGLLENEHNQQMVSSLARAALDEALSEAKAELRNDADLKRLGIDRDVERLIDGIVRGGGNLEGDLEHLIERAMAAAMKQIEREAAPEKKRARSAIR